MSSIALRPKYKTCECSMKARQYEWWVYGLYLVLLTYARWEGLAAGKSSYLRKLTNFSCENG